MPPRRQFFRGPRCDVSNCKSTLYYTEDGLTYCHHNHLAHGVLEYQIDEDEAMASGFGSRRKREPRNTEGHEKENQALQYHGKLGFGTYLQAYQVIVRYQTQFIAKTVSVPAYSTLVRKLWQLLLEAQHAEDSLPEDEPEDDEEQEEAQEGEEQEDESEPEHEDGPVLDSDSGTSVDVNGRGDYESAYYAMHRPLLIHTIALSYLTLLILRVPVTIHHFKTWIDTGAFPYISAIKLVPDDLRARLEGQYHAALDPQLRPRASRIWKWTQQTAMFLNFNTDMVFPDLNYQPVLRNVVKEFLLPLDIYNLVESWISGFGINMGLFAQKRDPLLNIPPETRVTCICLIAAKIFYSLDDIKRKPVKRGEPADRAPSLRAWQRAVKIMVSDLQGVDLSSKTQPKDVYTMDDLALDDYLDWYAKTWLVKPNRSTSKYLAIPEGILNIFPVTEGRELSAAEIRPSGNKLETIRWLYSIPRDWTPVSSLVIGEQYCITTLHPGEQNSLWDDLIELAALQCHLTTREMRKHIMHLEKKLAPAYRKSSTNNGKRKRGRPQKNPRTPNLSSMQSNRANSDDQGEEGMSAAEESDASFESTSDGSDFDDDYGL